MNLIDKDKLLKILETNIMNVDGREDICVVNKDIIDKIICMPTQSQWKKMFWGFDDVDKYECLNCGHIVSTRHSKLPEEDGYNVCPHCMAKMTGVIE